MSNAIPFPLAPVLPERKVENKNALPDGFTSVTNAADAGPLNPTPRSERMGLTIGNLLELVVPTTKASPLLSTVMPAELE